MMRLPAFLLIVFLIPEPAHTQSHTATAPLLDILREQIRVRIEAERQGLDALDAKNDVVRAPDSVIRFYEQRGFDPAWIGPRGPRPTVDSLLAALRRADQCPPPLSSHCDQRGLDDHFGRTEDGARIHRRPRCSSATAAGGH